MKGGGIELKAFQLKLVFSFQRYIVSPKDLIDAMFYSSLQKETKHSKNIFEYIYISRLS